MLNWLNLGIHEEALKFRAERSVILATNLAQADTPGYKAKDINFKNTLEETSEGFTVSLSKTSSMHQAEEEVLSGVEILYRVPTQISLDGNTVDAEVEKGQFLENSTQYLATMQFLNQKISLLTRAIRGE